MQKKSVRLKLGDVFRIPLLDGSYGYIQYIRIDPQGLVVRVSNKISKTPKPIQDISDFEELLFPPV